VAANYVAMVPSGQIFDRYYKFASVFLQSMNWYSWNGFCCFACMRSFIWMCRITQPCLIIRWTSKYFISRIVNQPYLANSQYTWTASDVSICPFLFQFDVNFQFWFW